MRPHGFFGKPLLLSGVIRVQVVPPSAERNRPLPDGCVRAFAAGAERPAFAPEIPHAGEHHVGIRSGPCAMVEQPVERFAPFRTSPRSCRRRSSCRGRDRANRSTACPARSVNGVAVRRVDDDLRDALGVRQAHVRPGLAAVGRLVDAVADRDAVARPRFAGADPDVFRILRIERDRADRLHGLLVEHRLVTSCRRRPISRRRRSPRRRRSSVLPSARGSRRARRRDRSSSRNRCCARRGRRSWRN